MFCSILIEIDATDLFADESVNWRWCVEHANFAHRDACEFIVHIGSGVIANMMEFGCTDNFTQAYKDAAAAGAARVLFYV